MKPKQALILFFKVILILIAGAVLAFCLFELPEMAVQVAEQHPEAAHLQYPVLIGIYLFLIPLFIALYQSYKLLICIGRNTIVSDFTAKALKSIEYCAYTIIVLIVLQELAVLLLIGGDLTPLILLGIYGVLGSIFIAVLAGMLQKLLEDAVSRQSKKKLIV